MTHAFAVHLLYATIVWIAAWLVTSIRSGSATAKYWIWVATSLNFVLPLSTLPRGMWPAQVSWFTPATVASRWISSLDFGTTIGAIWLAGTTVMLARLVLRIRAYAPACKGPAVEGLFRPVIRVPQNVRRQLTPPELDAVLIHEVTHARRRDNLIRLVYELSVCAFWFHPLVWITGSRLALYRELSCDEAVARRDRAGDLISALAKLAAGEDGLLLQSSASSFISDRVAHLTARERRSATIHALLTAAFVAVMFAAVAAPVALSAASEACARTRASAPR